MQKSFTDILSSLNPKQREAVDTIYGPVLVIAGPGSGKTQLLAVRIANILRETDANPSNIICLTFTDNAARNMRERLRGIIGQDAYKVAIHTFHTFGLEILNRFRQRLLEDEDLSPIDDIETSRIFHEMIQDLPWDHPWKKKSRLGTLRNTIKILKDAGISPEDLRHILDINEQILNHIGRIIESHAAFFALGQKKEEKLEKVRQFGKFADMIRTTLDPLASEYGLYETLKSPLLRSLDEALASIESESDTKPITAWKSDWLQKMKEGFILKEAEKHTDTLSLLGLYEGYQEALKSRSLIDFSDMILRAIRLVETDETVRSALAEQYQWIMVDEYQDTNDAQLRLITSVLDTGLESPNIFAVGDDDQSIYKFQGANTRNIRLFRDLYSDTRLIILEENYRSLENIILSSRRIMTESEHSLGKIFPGEEKKFHAARGEGGEIIMKKYATELEELTWIAKDIEDQIASGVAPSEIAVITKKNETLEYIAKLLLGKKIPVALSKEENIFSNEVVTLITNMLLYVDSLSHREDRDDLLVEILAHPMWEIHRLTLWELSRQIGRARKEENSLWIEVMRRHEDKNLSKIAHFFIELSLLSKTKRLEEIIDIITGADGLIIPEDYTDTVERNQFSLDIDGESRAYQSPLFSYYFSREKLDEDPTLYARHLANIRKLIESIRSFRKTEGRLMLEDFSAYMSLIREYDITLSASGLIGDEHAVQCITAHKAKGLEYSHVYAIGLTEKKYKRGKNTSSPLPANLSLAPEKDDDEDIRRLIYTVMTRAKDHLVLTYAEKSIAEKGESLVSVLSHIEPAEWEIATASGLEDSMTELLSLEYHDLYSLPYTGDERSFLQSTIDGSFALSATALQNFLDVTSGGPVNFLANNILRFPQVKSSSAVYGTAMHKALEDFFKDYKQKGTYKKDILFSSFEKKLREDGLDEVTERDMLARGKANLDKLYPKITGQSYGEIHLEHRFTAEGGGAYVDDTRLTGAIDRIEITPDGKLIVTDYKTGEGFSNLSGGSGYEAVKKWKYHLQLTFYALLFSLSPRWSAWKTREFRLFFIEEDRETGEFSEVIEYIQEGEIERMKKLIIAVMTRIRSLDFPDVSEYEQTVAGIRQFEEDLLTGMN